MLFTGEEFRLCLFYNGLARLVLYKKNFCFVFTMLRFEADVEIIIVTAALLDVGDSLKWRIRIQIVDTVKQFVRGYMFCKSHEAEGEILLLIVVKKQL